MTASKGEFFNPAKLSARDKAEATDHSARAIVAAEAKAREKKTEMLKALRLQQAATSEAETPPKRTRAKATAPKP